MDHKFIDDIKVNTYTHAGMEEASYVLEELDRAKTHNLEAEVMYSFLRILRENNNVSPETAIIEAMISWDI